MTVLFRFLDKIRYSRRVAALHASLGIPDDYAESRGLALQPESRKLACIGTDIYDRQQHLMPEAASAWQAMRKSAATYGINLQVVSGFRSVDYQAGIVKRKLESGQSINEILRVSAAPGYSEHHTGRALDLTTPDSPVLEEPFENSEAFAWLTDHAGEFGLPLRPDSGASASPNALRPL